MRTVGTAGNADGWVRALRGLFLVTLAIGLVAAAMSFPIGPDWVLAGTVTALLVGADAAAWHGLVPVGRPAVAGGYFLVTGAVVGLATAVFPMYAVVAFGLLPVAFVRLSRWAALAVGVVTTGLPYVVQPFLGGWLRGLGWQHEGVIRFGTAYFVMVGVALPVLAGLCTAGAVQALRRQNHQRQILLEQLSTTREDLATASRLTGRAEERQRLAHELHDTLAQGLSGVVLQLEAAEQYLGGGAVPAEPDRVGHLVVRARETACACLADTRRAVAALRPEPLDGTGLTDAVGHLCRRWAETTGVPAEYTVRGTARALAPSLEVAALRVVQEALANAGQHASAEQVGVTVEYGAEEVRLVVDDDGRGFDPAVPGPGTGGGFGLATMRERVAAIGGSLSIRSAPGAGTTVRVMLPAVPAGPGDGR